MILKVNEIRTSFLLSSFFLGFILYPNLINLIALFSIIFRFRLLTSRFSSLMASTPFIFSPFTFSPSSQDLYSRVPLSCTKKLDIMSKS